MTDDIWNKLAAEFPRDQISWRAQNIKADGTTALALGYIDARDVMDRLDAVCGPDGWQDRYEVHGSKTICYLSLRVGDQLTVAPENQWVTKADGAGDSDIEGDKGAISDALKRAAVKWGIGRYLYAIPSPWVPCDSYKDANGKMRWRKWTADPWEYVKTAAKPAQGLAGGKSTELAIDAAKPHWLAIMDALKGCTTTKQLNGEFERHRPVYDLLPEHFQTEIQDSYYDLRAGMPDGKPKPPQTPPPKAADPKFAVSAEALALAGLKPTVGEQLDKLQADPGYGKP